MKNSDMPAIPVVVKVAPSERPAIMNGIPAERVVGGITKREMMAMAAMQGLCTHSGDYHQPEHLAMDAVMFADALLAELESTK